MLFRLETQIIISSSAPKVWEILMDFEGYPSWNPFIKHISGVATRGNTINIELGGMKFKPEVQELKQNQKFSWLGKLFLKGLFDGNHEFIIEVIDGKTVVFHQNESFSGILVPFLKNKLKKETKTGFQEMNQALKERCEK